VDPLWMTFAEVRNNLTGKMHQEVDQVPDNLSEQAQDCFSELDSPPDQEALDLFWMTFGKMQAHKMNWVERSSCYG